MACVCKSCLGHFRLLGIAQQPKSKAAIHRAYRAAAKLWHPDRFESNPKKRGEAEERFKRIHAAYQALCEHFENPTREAPEAEFVSPIRRIPMPTINFGGAPDCYGSPHFPARIREAIEAARVEPSDPPVAFIDLSVGSPRSSHFILLTGHRMYVRDTRGILSVVWYSDLGELELVDLQAGKKPGAWQRIAESIAGKAQRYLLRICRLNGTVFRELTDRPDDRVKKVVYNFLRQMKSNWHP